MKRSSLLVTCLCIIFISILVSCHKNQAALPPFLNAAPNSLLIDSLIGSKDSFNVNSNTSWKVTLSPASASDWLQLSQTEGQSNATVRLTITGRNINTAQAVTISVAATGNADLPVSTITLSQQGSLRVDSGSFNISPTSGADTFHIISNLAWKVSTSVPWIHLDTTQGAGPGRIRISADTNRTGIGQTGYVIITPVNNSNVQPASIRVDQYAYYVVTSFSPATGPVGTTVTFNGIFPPNVGLYFQSTYATITSHSATQVVCTVPQGSIGGLVNFTNADINNQFACVTSSPFNLKGGWNNRSNSAAGLPVYSPGAIIYNYNGNLYTGFGTTTAGSIYRLDTTNFHWIPDITVPASLPFFTRAFSYIANNKLYLGGASNNSSTQTMWEYDLTKGNSAAAWRQLTTPPDDFTFGYAFTQGGNGYIQTGQLTLQGLGTNTLYKFSVSGPADPGTWTPLTALNVTNAVPSGFTIGNTTWFGGGTFLDPTQGKAFNSLTLPSTTMTAIAPYPETLNTNSYSAAPSFVIGNTGYLYNYGTGNIYGYDPGANDWTLLSQVPYYNTGYWFAGAIGSRIFSWSFRGAVYEYLP